MAFATDNPEHTTPPFSLKDPLSTLLTLGNKFGAIQVECRTSGWWQLNGLCLVVGAFFGLLFGLFLGQNAGWHKYLLIGNLAALNGVDGPIFSPSTYTYKI